MAVTASFVTSSFADINVDWKGPDGFLKADDVTGIVSGGTTALAQLIYSPLIGYSSVWVNGGVDPGYQILDTVILTDSGGADPYGTFVASYSGAFQPGFIYARIFDGGTGNPANIGFGTMWYDSPIIATVNNLTPETPDQFNVQGAHPSLNNGGFGDNLYKGVPEPTTLAFLSVGGLVLAIRRRKA